MADVANPRDTQKPATGSVRSRMRGHADVVRRAAANDKDAVARTPSSLRSLVAVVPYDLTVSAGSVRSAVVLSVLFCVLGVILTLGVFLLPFWMACLVFALPLRVDKADFAATFLHQWWFKAAACFVVFGAVSLIWAPPLSFASMAGVSVAGFVGLLAAVSAFVLALNVLSPFGLSYVRLAAGVGLVVAMIIVTAKAVVLEYGAADSVLARSLIGGGAGYDQIYSGLQMNGVLVQAVSWTLLAFTQDTYLQRTFGLRPGAATLRGGVISVAGCLVLVAALLASGLAPGWTFGVLLVAGCVFVFTVWKPKPTVFLLSLAVSSYILFAPSFHLLMANGGELDADPAVAAASSADGDGAAVEVRWRTVSAQVFDAPIFGHGIKASPSFATDHAIAGGKIGNVVLQVWYEFGLLGALLLALIVFDLLNALARGRHRRLTVAALAASSMCLFALSFSGANLRDPWFLTAVAAVAFYGRLAVHRPLASAAAVSGRAGVVAGKSVHNV